MPTADESRRALTLVSAAAVEAALRLVPGGRRELLSVVPEVIGYYSEGTAALAADFYDDERADARARGLYIAAPVVPDRGEKIGRAVAWAAAPLDAEDTVTASSRLAEVVQLETARPYRETVLTNRQQDPEAVGWRRVARGDGCKFCQMLADRGAVFRSTTARFAAHTNCNCAAQPVFASNDTGDEASVLQYVASRKRRSKRDRVRLREYLDTHYPDAHG